MNLFINVISVYLHIRNTQPETRICNTQASDIHQDSFVGGSLLVSASFIGAWPARVSARAFLIATAWLPNSVLTKTTPLPGYTAFSSLNLYHVPYLRPCYVHQQFLPNIIQDLKCFDGWHLTVYTKCDWHPIKSLVCCHTSYPH